MAKLLITLIIVFGAFAAGDSFAGAKTTTKNMGFGVCAISVATMAAHEHKFRTQTINTQEVTQ